MEKILYKKPVDFSIKNKEIAFCSELPIGILSFNRYLDTELMKMTYSSVEINEHYINRFYVCFCKIKNFRLFRISQVFRRNWL